jgi:hypothetical protein
LSRLALFTTLISAAFGLALVSSFAFVGATHSNSLIGLLAIDANVQGNTATSIGPIDGCARVEPGAQIDVDYVVDAIPEDRPMIAFEVLIKYDPALLEVVAVDYDLMLAAVGSYQPFTGLTDELPDSDGEYRLVVLDTASQTYVPEINQPEANVERGKGTLARITLRAKAAGVSEVAVGYDPANGGPYPLTQDTQNETIIVDKIGGASIAIGQDCPPEVIAPKIIDPPNTEAEIFGGTPPAGVPTVPGGSSPGATAPTPEGQTPTPEGQTPGAGESFGGFVPCPVTPLPTPAPTPTAAPSATDAAPGAETPTPVPDASPAPTVTEPPVPTETPAPLLCTPTPSPVKDDIIETTEDSNTGLIVGAVALLGLGTAAAGGGWYAFRRSRNGAA